MKWNKYLMKLPDKKTIIIALAVFLLTSPFSLPLLSGAYFKIYDEFVSARYTNPQDPNFNPQEFDFKYYVDYRKLSQALRHMFPKGTKKEYVEGILVKKAGATSKDYGDFVAYRHAVHGFAFTIDCVQGWTWNIKIYYNEANEVEKILTRGPC